MKRKLAEVAADCGIEEDHPLRFVAFSWVKPVNDDYLLDEEDVARARLIHELQGQLGVNDESVPIILHLLDQLHRLHWELRRG